MTDPTGPDASSRPAEPAKSSGTRGGSRAPLTSARSKARREALDILFEAEQRGFNALDMLDERTQRPARENPPRPFAAEIVRGVAAHWGAVNDLISTYSQGWSLERLPAVDRAALRLGIWEVLYHDDTPDAVAVSEAVALVAALSTDDSPAFVNGLLSRIVQEKPTLV